MNPSIPNPDDEIDDTDPVRARKEQEQWEKDYPDPTPNERAVCLRTYYKVNSKSEVTGKFKLRPDQVAALNKQLLFGERLMRHPPK